MNAFSGIGQSLLCRQEVMEIFFERSAPVTSQKISQPRIAQVRMFLKLCEDFLVCPRDSAINGDKFLDNDPICISRNLRTGINHNPNSSIELSHSMTATKGSPAKAELPLWNHQPAVTSPQSWWENVCEKLRGRIGPAMFERWFANVSVETTDEHRVVLAAPDLIHLYWIEDNYLPLLQTSITEALEGPREIQFITMSDNAQGALPLIPAGAPAQPAHKDEHRFTRTLVDAGLNNRFSFDSFVEGPNCSYSCAVARAVADKPGKTYNPLFLHGAAGLGKTHLMQAIGQEIIRLKPRKTVRYVTSEMFTNEFIEAVRHGRVTPFRQKYRKVDVLLVDDIHFFGGKDSTQEEFFHTFNELFNSHKQVVLASDRAPSEIKNLENRLVSRFEWGLATQIQTPDLETRTAILRQKMREWTVQVPEWVLEFLASNIRTNVRRLEGALMRVGAHVSLGGAPLSQPLLETMLSDIIEAAQSRSISVDWIQKVVAEHFDIRLADMTSHRRPKVIAEPRQIAMYFARELTKNSLVDIGDAFGGRDHGTVIHACKVVGTRLASEVFRRTIVALREKITKI
jgi:chromosomal replication initiator protein